ncbi:hybrid sensor histidine kinase/response regulator [Steroidobacter denitrificans]|nr:PAS domain-containing protein [Steroidobacter denitrificans]
MTVHLRFVLLEDDSSDAELIRFELARNGLAVEWLHAVSEGDFRKALDAPPPDLVLADYTLPGFDGLAALKIAMERCRDVPFIFVSGSLGEERAIEALKSGATDYVLKDRLQRLPAVVKRALTEARERRERRLAETALEEQRILLGTLIDNLPQIIYAVDADNRLTVINAALLKLAPCKAGDILGRRLSEIWKDEDTEEIEALAADSMRTARPLIDQERARIAPNGSMIWYTLTLMPLRDQKSVSGLVATIQDVTARKVLEQEILEISNREQRRLGSDLHDGLGQELTGLSLLVKGLEMQVSRESPQYLAQITKISGLLAQAIQSTRSLARGLTPVNLEHGGLPEALKLLAEHCSDIYNLSCTFDNGALKLPELEESAATHLYRIAQEATTNAARHARARAISIELRYTARRLHLIITDDGIGLSTALARGAPGMGLKIMEYRARMLGGTITFEEPGKGTRIALSAPLQMLRRTKELARRGM